MMELFSRKPDVLTLPDGIQITPIPNDDDLSSLSAILLDDSYYRFVRAGQTITKGGLSYVKPEYLIPLKIYAWMDLTEKKMNGHIIDSKDIKKHRNDVFRLFQLIRPTDRIILEGQIYTDVEKGLHLLNQEKTISLKSLGLKGLTVEEAVTGLHKLYSLIP